jgi:tRNA G46 methylase TrmB
MADFSDKEDQRLVQLLIEHEKKGQKRVSWIEIANLMKSRKSPEQLRLRLACLKKRFGKVLVKFPHRYLANLQGKKSQPEVNETISTERPLDTSLIDLFDEFCKGDEDLDFLPLSPSTASTQAARSKKLRKRVKKLLLPTTTPSTASAQAARSKKLRKRVKKLLLPKTTISPLSTSDTYVAVKQIFEAVRKEDVRQPSGRVETNVGELTPYGTTGLIEAFELTSEDVFVDIGSGVGNVVAQVALHTSIKMAIGVEIRAELAHQGRILMEQNYTNYPQLKKVQIYPKDICDIDIENDQSFQNATVVFCHNTLFRPEVHLEVEKVCCRLPHLRTVIVSLPFCIRHRASCLREFCTLFHPRQSPIGVSVTFTHSLSSLFVYDRSELSGQK